MTEEHKIFNLSNYFSYNLRPNYDLFEIDEKDLNNYILTPRNETELSNLSIINCIIRLIGEVNHGLQSSMTEHSCHTSSLINIAVKTNVHQHTFLHILWYFESNAVRSLC